MATTIFSDDFSTDGQVDASKWMPNVGAGSFLVKTQMNPNLPSASGGIMKLVLDTFNPTDPKQNTFQGSEAISTKTFDLSQGPLAFEAQFKYEQTQPGIIGGFFLYQPNSGNLHDEIDFEGMSKFFNTVQTNIYHQEPSGDGHFEIHPPPSIAGFAGLGEFHTYRIEWYPTMVRWLVDGTVVRESTDVPTNAMALHFNIWTGESNWRTGDSSLQPTGSPGQHYTFDIDNVKVDLIPTLAAQNAASFVGSAEGEYLAGGLGNDTFLGAGGNDVIEGGAGINTASWVGAAKNFALSVRVGEDIVNIADRSGTEGTDAVHNVQNLHFADSTLDASTLVKAADLSSAAFGPLIDLYTGYLNRAPDALGLAYWASKFSDGMSLTDIARSFFTSTESASFHHQGQSLTDMVSSTFTTILNRPADAGGLNYWVGQLQSGQITADKFVLAFIQAASAGGADGQTLANKEAVGAHYALDQGLTDGTHAAAVLAVFSGQPPAAGASNVQAANNLTDGYAAAAAAPGSSELVVQLVGVHVGLFDS